MFWSPIHALVFAGNTFTHTPSYLGIPWPSQVDIKLTITPSHPSKLFIRFIKNFYIYAHFLKKMRLFLISLIKYQSLSVFYPTLVFHRIFPPNLLMKNRSKKMHYIYPVASGTSVPLLNISVWQTCLVFNQYLLSPSYPQTSDFV